MSLLLPAVSALAQDTTRIPLQQAISLAAARNIDLLRARNTLRTSQTRIDAAEGAFQPTLSLSANPSLRYQLGSSSNAAETETDRGTGSFSVNASSSYTLYDGNANRATLEQARILARATEVGTTRDIQTVVNAVVTGFYQVATNRELVEVARENLLAVQQELEQVRAFTDAGTRPISDLYAQEATVASAEMQVLTAQQNLETTKLALVEILRLDPLGVYDFPTPESAPQMPSGDVGALVNEAYSRRPEVAAQRARIEAAEQGIRIAEAGYSPTVGLSGGIGSSFTTQNDRDPLGSQLFTQNPNASVGLSFSLPIFDRDRTDVAVEQARIELENERLTLAGTQQAVALDVRQALLDLRTAETQVSVAERQLRAATQGLDVEQTRYRSGVSTLVELTQARARFVAAEGQLVQARNTLELRRQAVAFAVGITDAPRVEPQVPETR